MRNVKNIEAWIKNSLYTLYLTVSSSRKSIVNGCNIKVIEPTTECMTGCVTIFYEEGKRVGIRKYRHKNKF